MRIFTRRKSGPVSTAIILLALVFVVGVWTWAARHIPQPDAAALRGQCRHLLLPIGVQFTGGPGQSRREANYLCLPDYFGNPVQYQVTSLERAAPQVVAARTWGPMLFVGVLMVFAAFFVYARRSRPNPAQ